MLNFFHINNEAPVNHSFIEYGRRGDHSNSDRDNTCKYRQWHGEKVGCT